MSNRIQAANIAGRFMASHSGNGLWHLLDTEASEDTAEVLCNIVPVGFTGDLGQLADVPTYDTSDVPDLVRMLTHAVDGISMGGWEVGRPVSELVAEAEAILVQVAPWSQLCPDGRTLYYEGDDPDGFARAVKTQFGFDVAEHRGYWPVKNDDESYSYKPHSEPTWNESHGWQFHCPVEHIDAIYGDETFRRRWPLGS